jgi:hypothetical protein
LHFLYVSIDINKNSIDTYRNVLKNKIPNAFFVHQDLKNLVKQYPNINTIVSPASSYGDMNGGIDRTINEILSNIEQDVKQRIENIGVYDNSYRKYLPVSQCEIVHKNNMFLFVCTNYDNTYETCIK